MPPFPFSLYKKASIHFMKRIYRSLFGYVFLMFLLVQCKSNRDEMSDLEVARIKQTYSAEVINYFYETVFFQDYVGVKRSLSKWENDVWIYLEGTLWARDSLDVVQVVQDINHLNLPIKLYLTNDESRANLVVYFGDFDYLKGKLAIRRFTAFRGKGKITENSHSIVSAIVGVANNAMSYANLSPKDSAIMRQSILVEEIAQSLGVLGDSWMDYYSTFFEGKKNVLRLQTIDKEIIKLLYEPSIPAKLSKKKFEKYFEDILYPVNAKRKLINYVRENRIPVSYLQCIRNSSFHDSTLLKFSKRVFVKIIGDYQQHDLETCKNSLRLLNTVSDQIQLEIAQDDIWHDLPSIIIEYNDSSLQTAPIAERFLEPGKMMLARRVNGRIKLSYGRLGVPQEKMALLLFEALYRILGFDHIKDAVVEVNAEGEFQFKQSFGETLSLLYNPIIPHGFAQKELDEVIRVLE